MKIVKSLIIVATMALMPLGTNAVLAQAAPTAAPVAAVPAAPVNAPAAPATEAPAAPAGDATYSPMKPTEGVGMPIPAEELSLGETFSTQEQYNPNGRDAKWINDNFLNPMTFIISIFVLGLLVWIMIRFNKRSNPNPSKTTHNTMIEIVWTLVPVLILVVIAVPSIRLIAAQYEPAPENAVTVKATGYQWNWGYTYPDHGGFEVISNMLSEEEAAKRGEPRLLGVDNRMVVPAGVPIRLQTTASDVIHSFAVPSLWFKLDSVPGRLNEKQLLIEKPGVYYGQCSELCGARHAYMPIVVEALPMDKFNAWVRSQGGTVATDTPAIAATTPAAAEASAPAAAPVATPAPAAPAAQ
jgi:cytochrome c oxidase subunit II